MPITRSDGFVVQAGDPDPEGDVHDFFPPGSSVVGPARFRRVSHSSLINVFVCRDDLVIPSLHKGSRRTMKQFHRIQ